MVNSNKEAQKQLKVLLALNTGLLRESLAGLLNGAGFEILAQVENNDRDLGRATTRYNPDILLLDWDLLNPPVTIVRLLTQERNFKGAIVLLGQPDSPEAVVEVIQAGARGCLSLDLPGEEFVSRLLLLSEGDVVVSKDLSPALSQGWVTGSNQENDHVLSEREQEVVALVSAGATNKEIAQELTITENTVKVHLRHILDKLDLRNRQQLAAYAVREGIIEEFDVTEEEESEAVP